jgi:hypothetical protein
MLTFDAIGEGLQAMKVLVQANRKVGALLTFQHLNKKQCKTCFLFESKDKPVSQLIKEYGEKFEPGEFQVDEMPDMLRLRETALSVAASALDVEDGGHAEEFLIKSFATAFSQVSEVRAAVIYLSHSPCTTSDRSPSDSLPGWPPSCTAKLSLLASRYPRLSFSVGYYQRFGHLEGMRGLEDGAKVLKDLVPDRNNLGFIEL